MIKKTKTYMAKDADVKRACFLVDVKDKVLGRAAARVATILLGKHKATYTPHVDTGDMVIVINADKIRVTGRKTEQKFYRRYTGYPSGQRLVAFKDMLAHKPTQVFKIAVKNMLPKSRLGSQMIRKLKIYAGEKHEHAAQKPILLEV